MGGGGGTERAGEDGSRPRLVVRFDRALTRIGLRTPFARDCLLAVVWAAVSVAVLLPLLARFAPGLGVMFTPAEIAAVLVLVTLQCLVLSVRRIRPVTCLLVSVLFQLALVAVAPAQASIRVGVVVIATYTVASRLPPRAAVRWIVRAALVEVVVGAAVSWGLAPSVRERLGGSAAGPRTGADLASLVLSDLSVLVLYLGGAFAGIFVATRREHLDLLRARADAAEREKQCEARRAVEAERARMARELHDVAAHHLTGLVVQAAAAERLMDRDLEAAKEATRSVRAQGREALANLRLVVSVLRDRDAVAGELPEDGAPVAGLAALDSLVETARGLGDQIDLTVTGSAVPLSPVADLAAYRVLQEALANARQHAAGEPVRVLVEYAASSLRVEVENRRPPPPSSTEERRGFGLLGMRERADLAGATLTAGPDPADRWRVRLAVPLPPPEASS